MTSTPHSVDQEFLKGPLLNFVLFEHAPETSEIQAQLTNIFGSRLGEFRVEEAVAVELDEKFLLHFMITPLPEGDNFIPHPVLTGDPSAFEKATTQLFVALIPNNEDLELAKSSREARLEQINLLAQATAVAASLPGALLIHNTMGNVSVAPKFYAEGVAQNDYGMFTAAVWLMQTETGITAYTVGLVRCGHPELIAEDSNRDPSELFYAMMDVVNYVVSGNSFKDGDTFAFSEGADPLSISTTTYFEDESVPALRISL